MVSRWWEPDSLIYIVIMVVVSVLRYGGW